MEEEKEIRVHSLKVLNSLGNKIIAACDPEDIENMDDISKLADSYTRLIQCIDERAYGI